MDRPIAQSQQRRVRRNQILVWLMSVGAVAVLAILVSGWLKPTVKRSRIRTAFVERGEVAASLDAGGLVVPQYENLLTSPLTTRVIAIEKTAGSEVLPGQTIVRLDDRSVRLEMAKLEEQIALQENLRHQAQLDLTNTRSELKSQREIKALELKSFEFELGRNMQLFEMGIIVQDQVRKSETDVERVGIELRRLDESMINAKDRLAAQLEGLALEISILRQDLEAATEKLARTVVTVQRAGIITWVVPSEGVALQQGDPVVRVADLKSFRVDATLADVHASRLAVGQAATLRFGKEDLAGRVEKILPTVENGIVTFEVALDNPGFAGLRPNLRVDVHVLTERRLETLRVKRGPLLNRSGRDILFVVRDDRLVRTPVTVGLSNFEFYEITDGLAEGDEVVVSDMSDNLTSKEVTLR